MACLKCSIHSRSNPAGNNWPFRLTLCDVLQGLLYLPRSNVPNIIKKKKKRKKKERKKKEGKKRKKGKKNHSLRGVQFSSVQSLIHVHLFVIPWTAASQAFLSIPNSHGFWEYHNPCPLICDTIQPSHPLTFPSPSALNLSQDVFKWVRSSHQMGILLEFHLKHQSFQWTLRTDFL